MADVEAPPVTDDEYMMRTDAQCQEWAETQNCDLRRAKENELFVDIDSEQQFAVFEANIEVLKKHFGVRGCLITPSKSGLPNRHIVVTLAKEYSLTERIGLQAALGSDPLRELLSLRRAINREENVVIFFEPREAAK